MDKTRIRYIKEWISELPKGNITYKVIRGKRYAYLQWTEDGKQHSRIVKENEIDELTENIKSRKALEKILKEQGWEYDFLDDLDEEFYFTEVIKNDELRDFVKPVLGFKKRECYKQLYDYITGNSSDRVFILYGLRRTGKTTLIRQVISEMDSEMFEKTAFIQVKPQITLAQLNLDLRALKNKGIRYVFIDEVTLMEDFIEGAALLSDIFVASGMKIVLSGTDSLGFAFAEDEQLYDRSFMLHTTFIPYREFENVLGIKGIDEYIKYGGTMIKNDIDYHHNETPFKDSKKISDYIDTAIAKNIQHSLKNYNYGTHFRHLADLYAANELTSVINRVVEDLNHRFTIDVLTKDFKSTDLSISSKNLLKDRFSPNMILQMIDLKEVTNKLKNLLEIKNKSEQSIEIKDEHRYEIKEYLDLLDITVDIDTIYFSDLNKKEKRTVISQPGLRYGQAESLIQSLMMDEVFKELSIDERNVVTQRILSDIKGRMMEEIVLLETKMAFPKCEVFKLVFARGEFDMVVFDKENSNCAIYEIKHSDQATNEQFQHLIDQEKCDATAFRFGKITGKYVLYRGESFDLEDIHYLNVEEYLKNLN